tara:strand:+ start:72 stop:248 length:177 start_codon:yes stop_codon:yes gene_type:complete
MNLKYGAISKEASAISSQPTGINGTSRATSPAIKVREAIAGIMNFLTSLRYGIGKKST